MNNKHKLYKHIKSLNYNLNPNEINLIIDKYINIRNTYVGMKKINMINNLMIQDNRIIEYVVKLYLENKIYLLDYFPLFLAYPGNHDLTSILINLLMIDTTNGKDSDCYHIFCNLFVSVVDEYDNIKKYSDPNVFNLLSTFYNVEDTIFRYYGKNRFHEECLLVDQFLDDFFLYVIFNNKALDPKTFTLLEELQNEFVLFYEKINLNDLLHNVPGYLDYYYNENTSDKKIIK